jgi:uncharacterized membrane protein YphA (DoxX/SURF4 family)
MKNLGLANRILLGLLMLVPGLLKLLVVSPGGVTQMLSGNFLLSWAPAFWAWVLIIGEIGSGIAIFGNWRVKHTAIIPVVILSIALLTMAIKWSAIGQTSWSNVLLHLVAISGYVTLSYSHSKG